MAIIQGNAKQGSTRGFYPKVINGSLRFNDDDSARLNWTPASAGNRKTWTLSFWMKNCIQPATNSIFSCETDSSNKNLCFFVDYLRLWHLDAGTTGCDIRCEPLLRDPSAWYHVVFEVDTTQATDTDRVKFWVNGTQITTFSSASWPSQNHDFLINTANIHDIGGRQLSNDGYFNGYLANVHFIDGQALTPSDFGETKNGVWVAKDYTGTFGTNGFYLTFEDDTQVEAFNTVLYRGTGAQQSITGTGFTPDLIWTKNRTAAFSHFLIDSVRGREKYLNSNSTGAEVTATNRILSFDSDGFTVGDAGGSINGSGNQLVAWCWDAGANNAVTGHSSVTYTGNGGTQDILGFPFQPDLLWIKARNISSNHRLIDSVRGTTKTFVLNTDAEKTDAERIDSFEPNGFQVTRGSYDDFNTSGNTYVAWAWDAGDSDPVSNTDGSITSTVKASQANGFSIVSYTGNGTAGATVGHGLSSAPDMVIYKNRSTAYDWNVYHSGLTSADYYLYLNTTAAQANSNNVFNDTAPSSSVLTLGTNTGTNGNGNNMIAYCFHDVTGKQKFGSYTGNGSTSGPTVTLGFRPGWLMIKSSTYAAENWVILDGSRDPFADPYATHRLDAERSLAESIIGASTGHPLVKFTDTGFQIVGDGTVNNGNGETYIYAAFAGSYSDYITDYNTDGSIDSRVKASDTTGFSIVSYEGNTGVATVGHGLSATPDFVIVKDRTNSVAFPQWWTWHSSLGTDSHLFLNLTDGGSGTGYFDTSGMSSSTIGFLSDSSGPNTTGESYIAYCWTATAGRSAFGSYTGTGATGNTTTTGFKPAVVILKRTDSTGNWNIFDNTRSTDGNAEELLFPNSSSAEITSSEQLVFLSNGFEPNVDNHNLSGATYIYAAFADTREAAFWLDQSGNDNDWQPVNLDHNDTVADSPTNNFATLNPLAYASQTQSFSDGNLRAQTNTGNPTNQLGTIGVSSGKFYWEVYFEAQSASDNCLMVGIVEESTNLNSTRFWETSTGYAYEGTQGRKFISGSGSTYGDSFTVGDTVGVALDMDAGTLTFYKNGTSQGQATSGLSGTFLPAFSDNAGSSNATFVVNFGQQPFKYSPPE